MTSPKLAKTTRSGRTYTHPHSGRSHPSVTTVLGIVGKADALKHWAANEVAKYAVAHRETWAALDTAAAIDLLKREPLRMLDRAASRGTDVHAIAEAYAQTGSLPQWADEIAGYVDALRNFFNQQQPRPVLIEQTVFNEQVGYAGSFDLVAHVPSLGDGLCILDYKTSKAIYPDVAAQLAAYAHAPEYITENGTISEMPTIEHGAVVRLAADGTYEFVRCDIEAGFEYFCAVRAVYAIDTKPFLLGDVEPWRDSLTDRHQYIKNRLANVKQNEQATATLLASWPTALPTPKNVTDPDHMWLVKVDALLTDIERQHSLPFAAGNPAAEPPPPPPPPAAKTDEDDITVTPESVQACRNQLANASQTVRETAAAIAKEASAARRSISLSQKPTLRKIAIIGVMLDILTDNGGNPSTLEAMMLHLGLRTTKTLGADIGGMTFADAQTLSTLHDQLRQGSVKITPDATTSR